MRFDVYSSRAIRELWRNVWTIFKVVGSAAIALWLLVHLANAPRRPHEIYSVDPELRRIRNSPYRHRREPITCQSVPRSAAAAMDDRSAAAGAIRCLDDGRRRGYTVSRHDGHELCHETIGEDRTTSAISSRAGCTTWRPITSTCCWRR